MGLALRTHELADEVRASFLGKPTLGVHHQAVGGVGETGMPARVATLVIELVVNIPAEDAIAEATALLHQGLELLQAHHLAANHAIDVGQPNLDPLCALLAVLAEFFRQRFDGRTPDG